MKKLNGNLHSKIVILIGVKLKYAVKLKYHLHSKIVILIGDLIPYLTVEETIFTF